jgi:hypothetical protein
MIRPDGRAGHSAPAPVNLRPPSCSNGLSIGLSDLRICTKQGQPAYPRLSLRPPLPISAYRRARPCRRAAAADVGMLPPAADVGT